tara:strand:- start:15993 stop:16556 length:564 start_codon:yes stop_codon:yes gene_type:complete
MRIKDLRNHFLIAMPSMDDPIFKKSLILICDDNKDGTMGLIINKPIDDILIQKMVLDLDLENTALSKSKVYFGGPVNLDTGFFLHSSNYQTDKTLSISKNLSITADERVIEDIEKNNGPNDFIFTLGYAGWDKKQLDDEIKNGDWLILPVPDNSESIFSVNDDEKWDIYSSLVGMNLDDLSGKPGQA